MNKFLSKIHQAFGCSLTKNIRASDLTAKVVKEKERDLSKLKKTNGVIKVLIESGELNLKVINK